MYGILTTSGWWVNPLAWSIECRMSMPDDLGSNPSRGNIWTRVLYLASIVCIEGQYLVGSEYCVPFLVSPSYHGGPWRSYFSCIMTFAFNGRFDWYDFWYNDHNKSAPAILIINLIAVNYCLERTQLLWTPTSQPVLGTTFTLDWK